MGRFADPGGAALPGTEVAVYDIMGALREPRRPIAGGVVSVTATLDPIYLVSDGGAALPARPTANDERSVVGRLSEAEHIVLGQIFTAENDDPKKSADDEPPFGYQLDATTEMWVDVYNSTNTARTIDLVGRADPGWSVSPARRRAIAVRPMGRVSVPFTITASNEVRPRVDYTLTFEGALGTGRIPPTRALIQRKESRSRGR